VTDDASPRSVVEHCIGLARVLLDEIQGVVTVTSTEATVEITPSGTEANAETFPVTATDEVCWSVEWVVCLFPFALPFFCSRRRLFLVPLLLLLSCLKYIFRIKSH